MALSRRGMFGFLAAAPVGVVAAAKGAFASDERVYASKLVMEHPTFPKPYGITGEVGPEAVMPLRRMSDGRFGVEHIYGDYMVTRDDAEMLVLFRRIPPHG